jgi:hypothetical protein
MCLGGKRPGVYFPSPGLVVELIADIADAGAGAATSPTSSA